MATGSDQNDVGADQGEHGPEHEDLVGQRVEEGARAGGAVPAGEVAVDAVGARTATNHSANGGPRRRSLAGDQREQQPARPAAAATVTALAQRRRGRSGRGSRRPSAPTCRGTARGRGRARRRPATSCERARRPGRRARRRSPSISGASRWVRATPGSSTSTSTLVPISSSRRARGDAVLQLAQLGQALVHQRGGRPRRRGRRRRCRPPASRRRSRTSRAGPPRRSASSWSWSASVSPG